MIKQYFDYKMKKVQDVLDSPLTTPEEKKKARDDYSRFLSYFKQDDRGRVIVNKKIAREMMQLVKDGKIPLIMDEFDLGIVVDYGMPNGNSNYKFQSSADLVAVHKSPIPPSNDQLVTQENSGLTRTIDFRDPSGMSHSVPYVVGNDTIHFTLNCPVENHEVGNDWDSYKYAVMIRLDKLEKDKVLDVKSEDTFVDGNAVLGNEYIIFCPVGERENIQKSNSNATIIEYDGIPLNAAIARMIIYSGHKLEPYGTYGWGRDFEFAGASEDNRVLNDVVEREGYPILEGLFGPALHSETKYMARRMWKREYEALINLIEYCKRNDIDMPDEVVEGLLMANGAYALPGMVSVSIEIYKEYVIPILEKYGYIIDESFFEGIDMNSTGMKIINSYPSPETGMMEPCVDCPKWESELRRRVIKIVKNKSKNIGEDDNSSKK